MMKPASKIFLYSLYAIAALLVFLYLRFPSDLMKEILVTQVQKVQPDVQLETDVISPTIPLGIKLKPLVVSYNEIPVLRLDQLVITPRLLSLFSSNKRYAFSGSLGTGELNGRADTISESNTEASQVNLNLSHIPMAFLEILNQFQKFKPEGQIDAGINFDSRKGGGTADVNLDIAPAHIALDPPLMGLEALEFDTIKAQLTVSPRMMQIRSCDATGEQFESKITGSIIFLQPLEESRMSLSLTVKPQPAFIAEHKNDMLGGLLASDSAQKRGLVFRISGTLKNPNYVIR